MEKKDYFYKGILFQEYGNDQSTIDIPVSCSVQEIDGTFHLRVLKVETCNGEQVSVDMCLHLANGHISMTVHNQNINIARLGLATTADLNQRWIDGMVKISSSLRLCHGLQMDNELIKASKEHITWSTVHPQQGEISTANLHSKACGIVLGMTHNYNNKTWSSCSRMKR